MVKFTKDGSTATSAALKLARPPTGREMVAICAEHPFFSYDDWFMAHHHDGRRDRRRPSPIGWSVSRTTTCQSVRRVFDDTPGPDRGRVPRAPPAPSRPPMGSSRSYARCARRYGAVLVFDEMITGFRYSLHGAE